MNYTQHEINLLTAEKIIKFIDSEILEAKDISLISNLIFLEDERYIDPFPLTITLEFSDGYVYLDFSSKDNYMDDTKIKKDYDCSISVSELKKKILEFYPEITFETFYKEQVKLSLKSLNEDLREIRIKEEVEFLDKSLNINTKYSANSKIKM